MSKQFKQRLDRGQHTARILYDNEWEEYQVVFYKNGRSLGEQTTYHTDDLEDARQTAIAELIHLEVHDEPNRFDP